MVSRHRRGGRKGEGRKLPLAAVVDGIVVCELGGERVSYVIKSSFDSSTSERERGRVPSLRRHQQHIDGAVTKPLSAVTRLGVSPLLPRKSTRLIGWGGTF